MAGWGTATQGATGRHGYWLCGSWGLDKSSYPVLKHNIKVNVNTGKNTAS